MAKRKRRLPHGTLGEPIVLGIEAWQAIADTAQIELTRPVLARLSFATMALAVHGSLENSAPPKAALQKIEKLEKFVSDLRSYFPNDSDEASELFFSNLTEIRRYATGSKEQTQRVSLIFLLELLSHVLMLNQKLLSEILKQASYPHPVLREGDVWDHWILLLTIIFKRAGLPTTVRKDQTKPSQFVIFVRELQQRLPTHLYRKRSDDALAKAITRAREGLEEFIATGSLEFLLLNSLGAFKPVAVGEGYKFEVEPEILRDILETLDYADKPNI
jgi:hypothetical protein